MTPAALTVSSITPEDHLAFLATQPSASFLQTPAWAAVKSEWRAESIGWFRAGQQAPVGAGLVLHRSLPKIGRTLAYLPEGPVIDWFADDLAAWLTPMREHLRGQGAFGIRMGPPVVTRRWDAATIKKAIADDALRSLADVPATEQDDVAAAIPATLRGLGWRELPTEGGFSAGQPKYNFQLPLAGRTEDQVLA
ncbi:lipid II:glycine glycyltransferase FemX, partial [Solicola sp. PLA-1-18]|uniref:lipid II:glycine glycyltransferase FemX n=1 Tax=Solicola sp. PLA-1-18 TaxID=3380532 RepID=UPI003B81C0EF